MRVLVSAPRLLDLLDYGVVHAFEITSIRKQSVEIELE